MGRHLDKMLAAMAKEPPRMRRKGDPPWREDPEGLFKPLRRPVSVLDRNPLVDRQARPAGVRQSRDGGGARASDEWPQEFTATHIIEIRYKLHATQRRFAQMFGISVETLRNWEQGKRRPQGPARALLRVAQANPDAVCRALWRYRRVWWMD